MPNIGLDMLTVVVGLLTTAFKAFKYVQEGELGIKLTFGKAKRDRKGEPVIIKPGFAFLVPWVQTLRRHHVRQNTQHLDHQSVMIADGLIFNVSAIVIYRVTDIYKALFEIDDLDGSIHSLCMGIIREVLTSKKHNELSDMKTISSELLTELKEKAHEWGVEFVQFNLTDCAPSTESAPLVTAEAGVRMRMAALKKAAQEEELSLEQFSPVLAAALVGMPLVASISPTVNVSTGNGHNKSPRRRSFLEMLSSADDPYEDGAHA